MKKLFYIFTILVASMTLFSCHGARDLVSDYDLQNETEDSQDTTAKPIYLTGTKPIDSVDVHKLIYDFWRLETDEYPNNIKIYARVYDSLGNFVTNMANPYKKDPKANYFTSIKEDVGKVYAKKRYPIDTFSVREYGANDSIPYYLVLTVDNSGSMSGVQNAINDGTELFISMKMKYDYISLTTFGNDLDIKVPFSKDKEQILRMFRAKKNQRSGSFSAVYQSLFKCEDLFEDTPDKEPRVLVIFTDGDENYSKIEVSSIIKKAKEQKIHVFAVAFGYSIDEDLKSIAQNTGGKFYKAHSREELVSIFRDIYMSLRYYYLIQYRPPKYWGQHYVTSTLNVPERSDTLFAYGEYNTSDLWKDIGDEFTLPILFDFNKSEIKPESETVIDQVVDEMMSRPKLQLEIQGHTDNIGQADFNMKLSLARAEAVKNAIVAKGIDPKRLRTRGFGMTMPKVSNDSEEGRAKNRRTQFVILAK